MKFTEGGLAKQHLLERMARDADIIGGILVLDKEGNAVAQSGGSLPTRANFADHQYFIVQRDANNAGVYISQPFENWLHNNEPSIALSRRISDAAGNFAGVIVIAIRLEHFHEVLARLNVGAKGVLVILNSNGLILSRQPSRNGNGDVGRDVSDSRAFRAIAEGETSFVTVAAIDNVERLYTIGHVPGYPLVVNVALATQSILAGWWKLAIVIGPTSLLVCAAIVALAAVLQRKIEHLAKTEARLAMLATTDGLTGLANRRHFDATMETEWSRARREGTSLSILLIDADRFKAVNDKFGHLKGDEVLKIIAGRVANKARRAGDLAARFGGEEFILLLPTTRASAALGIAEAIRSDVSADSEASAAAGEPGTTISLGVATMTPDRSNSIKQLLMAADRALYQAKAEGRNRSVLARG